MTTTVLIRDTFNNLLELAPRGSPKLQLNVHTLAVWKIGSRAAGLSVTKPMAEMILD
jgi:hypothetical protein